MRIPLTPRAAIFGSVVFHTVLLTAVWSAVFVAGDGEREAGEFHAEAITTVPTEPPPAPPPVEPPELPEEVPPETFVEADPPEESCPLDETYPALESSLSNAIQVPTRKSTGFRVRPSRRARPAAREEPVAVAAPRRPTGPTRPARLAPGNSPPEIPARARRNGFEGVAILVVSVAADGSVAGIRVLRSSGHVLLDRAALKAVRDWRFHPALRAGRRVSSEIEVPVRFRVD